MRAALLGEHGDMEKLVSGLQSDVKLLREEAVQLRRSLAAEESAHFKQKQQSDAADRKVMQLMRHNQEQVRAW